MSSETNVRLLHYQSLGLVDCERNGNDILSWLVRNGRDNPTATDIDAAIEALKDVLVWNKPVATAPRRLKTGELELPINATKAEMQRASTKQLLDLLDRRRAATNQQYVRNKGQHGSKF